MDVRVIRVPSSSSEADVPYVLVHIQHHSDAQDLDLDLLASEGNTAYAMTLKSSRIANYRGKTFRGSDDDWNALLAWTLLGKQISSTKSRLYENVELVADVNDSRVELRLRRSTSGITQQLGALTLKHNESLESEVNVFEWAAISVQNSGALEKKLKDLEAARQADLNKTAALEAQLENLIEEKRKFEQTTLFWCQNYLNSYKMKIRDQNSLLAAATVDAKAAQAIKKSRSDARGSRDGSAPTRKSKRKASQDTPEDDALADDDEGGAAADQDSKGSMDEDEAADHEDSAQDSDQAGRDSGGSDDDAFDPVVKQESQPQGAALTPPAAPQGLPLQSRKQDSQPAPTQTIPDDEETEDEDDEL